MISAKGVKPVWDKTAGVKWITWDSDQWISYDDSDTFDQKRKFANSRCLGGSMVSQDTMHWAKSPDALRINGVDIY